jgi:hypothetical protein
MLALPQEAADRVVGTEVDNLPADKPLVDRGVDKA